MSQSVSSSTGDVHDRSPLSQSRANSVLTGGLIGLMLGVPWLGLSWLGHRWWGTTMPPFSLFDMLARALPGGTVTGGLELMVRLLTQAGVSSTAEAAKNLQTLVALALALVTTAALGAIFGWARFGQPFTSALPLGMSLGLAAVMLAWWDGWGRAGILLGSVWVFGLGLAWGLAMDWAHRRITKASEASETAGQSRRNFLARLAAISGGISLATWGLGRVLGGASDELAIAPFPPRATPTPPVPLASFQKVEGTRSELTPLYDFFRVDINLRSPNASGVSAQAQSQAQQLAQNHGLEIPAGDYLIAVSGLVQQPVVLDLDRILGLPRVDQFATLECISNPVGGDLIDTTWFSGTPLAQVLQLAKLQAGVVDIVFQCADGYSESLPIEAALDERTLLCYAMGGEALFEEHGFPYRLYTPNRFGIKNPKWIVGIQAVADDYSGYWQQRGWVEQGWVQTEAVIDAVRRTEGGAVAAGGVAFAGDRGLHSVEVRVDGGAWIEAELNRPLSSLCWVQWAAEFDLPAAGDYLFEARATDGSGQVQTPVVSQQFPAGATGYHAKRVRLPG